MEDRFKLYKLISYAVIYKAGFYIKVSNLISVTHGRLPQVFKSEGGPWLLPEFFCSVGHIHIAISKDLG